MSSFDLRASVHAGRSWLSYQGPIKDFVCLNPLMAFQQHEFYEGAHRAGAAFGAYSLMGLGFYRTAFNDGRITKSGLERAITLRIHSSEEQQRVREDLFQYPEGSTLRPVPIQESGVRQLFKTVKRVSLDTHGTPVLLRLISSYLDQGVALWAMPRTKEGFFATVRDLVLNSYKSFPPFDTLFAKSLLQETSENAAIQALESLLEDQRFSPRYILDLILSTPGWSAMINQVEMKPHLLLNSAPVSLLDFVSVGLVIDAAVAKRELKHDFTPLRVQDPLAFDLPTKDPRLGTLDRIKKIWHEAYEWSLYEQAFQVVAAPNVVLKNNPQIQAAFCIDDRECSIRRHLEWVDPGIETFGTAGFFGMDFLYQYYDDLKPSQNCPIVLTPRHLVRGERPLGKSTIKSQPLDGYIDRWSHSILGGILVTQLLGFRTLFRLLRAVLRPRAESLGSNASSRDADRVTLKIHSELEPAGTVKSGEMTEGYTYDEMADRVGSQLLSTGLSKNLADLVILVAHGSTTVNNTHFAAYDCGACMGKPGSPNARAFAIMANIPEVRKRLKASNIVIPESTYFVAALHDTTRDEIQFFDVENLGEAHRKLVDRFTTSSKAALANNARERCRRFEQISFSITPQDALNHVRERSVSIFEPRPELTHTGNALAIVGRRDLTRGFFMDRRAFMNSYDPSLDPTGKILAGILGAVVPVGGGINLTYFFSRMDNHIYGSGTKLPHNVVGLVGVSNGVEGDLLTGLPNQMVEVHEPVRLLVIVDQEAEIALAAAKQNPAIFEWIQNGWVRYGAVSPTSKQTSIYDRGKDSMVPLDLSAVIPLKTIEAQEACFANQHFYVPIARLAARPQFLQEA
ncbi:MAG: DUF2309 domain-containing protein [Proteobacteria bacterium]|nr:DUF2309 domain-containing protein [Pseudomonadota bacterium]